MVLGRKTNFFPREKMVLVEKTFSKDGVGKDNQLFPRENQKQTIFGRLCGQSPK